MGAAEHWFQQAQNGFCLPASIAQIVAEYTGAPIADEAAFIDIANDIGAFQVGYDGVPGIPFDKGVQILQEAGVPAEVGFGDLESMATHLAEDYSIIVFIDSGELWEGEGQEDWEPDHAVVVTGIDVERGTVILSDPGHPGGNLAEYPIELFMNSWADSENAWIVAEQGSQGATQGEAAPLPEEASLTGAQSVGAPDGVGAVGAQGDGAVVVPGGAGELDVVEMMRQEWAEGALPGGDQEQGLLERTTAFATRAPWILVPVALLARHLVSAGGREK